MTDSEIDRLPDILPSDTLLPDEPKDQPDLKEVPAKLYTLDASEFRVSASDSLGHTRKKTVSMPPMMANAISVTLAGKKFPYRTEGEFFRHALTRHLKYLERIGDIPSVSGQLEAMNAVLYEEQLNEEFLDTFNVLSRRMVEYTRTNDHSEARRLYKKVEADIERMPEGYWKVRSLKKLRDEHGWIMDKQYDEKSGRDSLSKALSLLNKS
jgi:hypothetical protein